MQLNYERLAQQKLAVLEAIKIVSPNGENNWISYLLKNLLILLDRISNEAIKDGIVSELVASGYRQISEDTWLLFNFLDNSSQLNEYTFVVDGEEYIVEIANFTKDQIRSSLRSRNYALIETLDGKTMLMCRNTNAEISYWLLAECLLQDYLL